MMTDCSICGGAQLREILVQEEVPVTQTPVPSNYEGVEWKGSLRIVHCQHCSHIFNAAFDPELEQKLYLNDFAASLPTTEGYLRRYGEIIDALSIGRDFQNGTVLEIGGGDFTFASGLLKQGVGRVCVFEPSDRFKTEIPQIVHVPHYFESRLIPTSLGPVDLIVMRHILEHVTNPKNLLRELAASIKPGAKLYVEVPNVEDILRVKRNYDFFYEHVNYFSSELLSLLLEQQGFKVLWSKEWVEGQHFGILAERIDSPIADDFSKMAPLITQRQQQLTDFQKQVAQFCLEYSDFFQSNNDVVIYGAGAHSISVISLLKLGTGTVRCLLDMNPFKHGRFSPLNHIPILPPSIEALENTDTVLVIASLHQKEIQQQLRDKYRFKGRIFGSHPALHELN